MFPKIVHRILIEPQTASWGNHMPEGHIRVVLFERWDDDQTETIKDIVEVHRSKARAFMLKITGMDKDEFKPLWTAALKDLKQREKEAR